MLENEGTSAQPRNMAARTFVSKSQTVFSRFALVDSDVLIIYSLALLVIASFQQFSEAMSDTGLAPYRVRTLFELNAGELLTLIAVWSVVKSKQRPIVLSKLDLAVVAFCSLFFLTPMPQSSPFLGATLAGMYFWRWRRNTHLASCGQLWLALSGYEVWGRAFFRIASDPIIRAETAVVAAIGQQLGFDLSLDGEMFRSPNGWSIYILDACSSFHNVSLAILVWLSLLKLSRSKVTHSALAALAVGVVGIIFLNVFRILLMTLSEQDYRFWHEGNGASVFSCLTLAAIALPTLISLRPDRRRDPSVMAQS
jgi:exosortase/archaeosortase family protein